MRYEVIVELKSEVLDPTGRAVQQSLHRLGHKELSDVKVSKRFVLEANSDLTDDQVTTIARDFLANPISETFSVRRLDGE